MGGTEGVTESLWVCEEGGSEGEGCLASDGFSCKGRMWVLMVTRFLFTACLPVSHLVVEEARERLFSFSA